MFENCNFSELFHLNLGRNRIKDISVLTKLNLNKLKILDLRLNPIVNIELLLKCKFDELVTLYTIGDIKNRNKVLEEIKLTKHFPKLEFIY